MYNNEKNNSNTIPNIKLKKKGFNLLEKKENTLNSLFEVEHFLNNFKNTLKYIKLYKLLK